MVVRFVPFQLTTEAEMKLVPFTVSVNAAAPAVAALGEIEVRDGTGLLTWEMVNVTALETPPPGAGLLTVTCAEPTVAISLAGIEAVSCVLLTNVVARLEPFHCTVVLEMNPVPVTVSVKAGPPAMTEEGESAFAWGIGLLPPPELFEPAQPDANVIAMQQNNRKAVFGLITRLPGTQCSLTRKPTHIGDIALSAQHSA